MTQRLNQAASAKDFPIFNLCTDVDKTPLSRITTGRRQQLIGLHQHCKIKGLFRRSHGFGQLLRVHLNRSEVRACIAG